MLNQIIPIVPVLIVALSACAVLLAEAFRRPGDWMPVGWLGIIGCVGGIVTSVSLWDRMPSASASWSSTTTRSSSTSRICAIGLLDDSRVVRHGRARPVAAGRVPRAHVVLDDRHDADGVDERPARHLHRARDHVARRLRADRDQAVERGRAPRRRSSTSCSARSRARSSCTASRWPTRSRARPDSTSWGCASPARRSSPTSCWSSRWCCSWSGSPSRFRPCRSTCGRRTPIKARPRS